MVVELIRSPLQPAWKFALREFSGTIINLFSYLQKFEAVLPMVVPRSKGVPLLKLFELFACSLKLSFIFIKIF